MLEGTDAELTLVCSPQAADNSQGFCTTVGWFYLYFPTRNGKDIRKYCIWIEFNVCECLFLRTSTQWGHPMWFLLCDLRPFPEDWRRLMPRLCSPGCWLKDLNLINVVLLFMLQVLVHISLIAFFTSKGNGGFYFFRIRFRHLLSPTAHEKYLWICSTELFSIMLYIYKFVFHVFVYRRRFHSFYIHTSYLLLCPWLSIVWVI